MSPILKDIASVIDTAALAPGARIAHVAELKGGEAGEVVSGFRGAEEQPRREPGPVG